MKKSLESPLTIDIISLLKFETYKIHFEGQMDVLSDKCSDFWNKLMKEEYDVNSILEFCY